MRKILRGIRDAFSQKQLQTTSLEGVIERFSHWDNNPTPWIMFMIEGDDRVFHLGTPNARNVNGSTENHEKWAITLTKPGDRIRFEVQGVQGVNVDAFTNVTMTQR